VKSGIKSNLGIWLFQTSGYLCAARQLPGYFKPKNKINTMKKLLVIIAIAGFMAACNNSSDSKTDNKDSTGQKMDSTKMSTDSTKK
jgi:hypothetical protein